MQEFSINLGIPAQPLAQNDEVNAELRIVYNTLRNIMRALDTYTGAISQPKDIWTELHSQIRLNGVSKYYVPAFEGMNPGHTVAFYLDAGVVKARKADGTYRCRGFCSNPSAVLAGEIVEVTLLGAYSYFASGTLTPNATYYQSAAAGQMAASGTYAVGFAITDKILFFNPTS